MKWGCDGSSGHSEYSQPFTSGTVSDGSLFLSSLVPLQLHRSDDDRKIYWRNPKPSSTRYCRPIRFEFVKESNQVVRSEIRRIETQISNLICSRLEVTVKELSMIDGKILQYLSDTPGMVFDM